MKIIAVVPAYNEAKRLGDVLLKLKTKVDGVVVVDDGSRDATEKVAREMGAVTLKHIVNRGQGLALRTGTEAALRLGADIIVHFDADGQHDDNFIENLIQPIKNGQAEVVFGSRFLYREQCLPMGRRIVLLVGKVFNMVFLGVSKKITDPQSGLRAFNKNAGNWLLNYLTQDRMAHTSEILAQIIKSDFMWTEIPVKIKYSAETLAKGQKGFDGFKIVWQFVRHKLHR
ncbi:MAG: Glycosyl transferase family 2 [candidate division CPR1 bacterium GW2011_GWA2_42_17]|uniref:Glycosyl transferase family 2 n=1 Tax=candidate division CPR1 bacterium GW2011_GWA2_42_17 TaxID=1618341 RepID=A0A0G1BDJ8_9BACT|nr:MAG: Glycosyl transferase family 2 [candidate division CPR1 bacterium GW2011_GWA2_42_17]